LDVAARHEIDGTSEGRSVTTVIGASTEGRAGRQ
jgi:hypothetical protein